MSLFWWVEPFSLECNEVSSSELLGFYGFGMTMGSMSFNAQGYDPDLLENYCGHILHQNLVALGWILVSV